MPNSAATYLLDVSAIIAWANSTGNESKVVLDAIKAGTVDVYNRIWDSANAAYPDECSALPKDEFQRKRCGDEHRLAAAALADKLRVTFPRKGAYDDAIEWTVVGVATAESRTIVTDERRKHKYEAVDGLSVITYSEMIDLL